MLYLIILFVITCAYLAFRRLDFTVMLFLLALPSYQVRFDIAGIPMTLLEMMILISFAVWFLKNYRQLFINLKLRIGKSGSSANKRYPLDIEIILLLIIAFISVVSADFSNAAFGVFKAYFFEPILVYILIFNVLGNEKLSFGYPKLSFNRFDKVIWPLVLSAFLVSLYAILQKFGFLYSPANFWPRVTGTFFYPNAVGLYLGPLVPLLVGHAAYNISNRQETITKKYSIFNIQYLMIIFYFFTVIFSIAAIFFAQSEGALIGLAASVSMVLAFWFFKRFKIGWLLSKLLVLGILIFVLASPFIYLKLIPEYKYFNFENRALNYIADKALLKDFSGEVRKQQWRETWAMLTANRKNFIFGAGLSGYQAAVAPYHQEGIFFNSERDGDFRRKLILFDDEYKAKHWRPVEIYMYPHSFILNVWSELGLAGVLIIVWLIIKIFCSIINFQLIISKQIPNSKFQIPNFLILGLASSFMVIMVHGLVDVPYFKNDLSVMFWVLISLVGMMRLDLKENKEEI